MFGNVTPRRTADLTDQEVRDQVATRFAAGEGEIDDNAAMRIASWWQSTGYQGMHLASLASGRTTAVDSLLSDIHIARSGDRVSDEDKLALDMLGTWVLNHPSRNRR